MERMSPEIVRLAECQSNGQTPWCVLTTDGWAHHYSTGKWALDHDLKYGFIDNLTYMEAMYLLPTVLKLNREYKKYGQ